MSLQIYKLRLFVSKSSLQTQLIIQYLVLECSSCDRQAIKVTYIIEKNIGQKQIIKQHLGFIYNRVAKRHYHQTMAEDLSTRKRARQQGKNQESGEPEMTKKLIVEGEYGPEPKLRVDKDAVEYDKMIKSLKKKKRQQNQAEQTNEGQREQIEKPRKQKRHKQKKGQKQGENQNDGNARDKSKKKKDKHRQKEDPNEEIKQEIEDLEDNNQKTKEKKQKKSKKDKEEEEVKQEKEKKKKSKNKKKDKEEKEQKGNEQGEEQKDIKEEQEPQPEKQKKKKKKKKEPSPSDNEEQSQLSSEQPKKKKTKKIKKQKQEKPAEKKRRGRKPQGPIKRKKQSIFERQQIINKKYRVKKRSHYLNKASDRAWGPMRAGPYRDVKKASKEEIQIMRERLYADKSQKNEEISQIEGDQDNQKEVVKIEQEGNQDQSAEEKIEQEPKKKGKKKNKESDSEGQKGKSKKKKSKKKKVEEKEEDQKKAKSKSKKKKKKVADDYDDVKLESTTQSTRITKTSNKSKKTQKGDDDQAKLEDNQDSKSRRRSTKKEDSSNSSDDDSDSGNTKKSKSKKAKKDDSKKQGGAKRKPRTKANRQQQNDFTKQQSEKIITLFSSDGGNYPQMMKQLPGIRLKKVRLHLRMLFHRALDTITYHVTKGMQRKTKEWQQDEKVEIVRQLHRIRSSNRLLSENNVEFRDDMTTLMRSYNNMSLVSTITDNRMQAMYRKLQAFVRGYNTINRSKRTAAASITESKIKQKEQRYKFSKEVTRKPIISGGHLLSKGIKSEFKEEDEDKEKEYRNQVVDPEKVMLDWSRDEEMYLCQEYINNGEADQQICDMLKEKYGPHVKWRDFELIGRKIDQLLKFALIKLQNLTARPYSQSQRKAQQERKRAKLQQKLRRQNQDAQSMTEYYKKKRATTSMFIYDNEIFQKEERLEYKHRIFKNLSLLERQMFGHIESYKLKTALVQILIEEFPSEQAVEKAVRRAKDFAKWARDDEKKANVSSIKNIFAGEREERDYIKDGHNDTDYMNDDSIMADVDKVDIIKRNYEEKEPIRSGQFQFSDEDDKEMSKSRQGSVKFSNMSMGQQANQAIEVDSDEQVYDFEEPPSKQQEQSCKQQQIDVDQQPYSMLEKLYTQLSNKPQK